MSIRKLRNGRWQADVADTRRGVARTKRTFDTRKQAAEWEAAVKAQAHDRLLGRRERQVFGQALARYLGEESTRKRSHADDLGHAEALRLPYWSHSAKAWRRLEHLPLDDSPGGIIVGLSEWLADQRAIVRRSWHGQRYHQQRREPDGSLCWYIQPAPTEGTEPPTRRRITSAAEIARIEATTGRGPIAGATLRLRQLLARRVLVLAYRRWRIIAQDLAPLIELERPAQGRIADLSREQLHALVMAAPPHLDDLLLAAAWIGWRWSNLAGGGSKRPIQGLTWDRVIWPLRDADTGALLRPGVLSYDADNSKTARAHHTPMSARVEALLRCRWTVRNGPLVFHRGDGRPFGDVRKAFARAKAAAGIPAGFRLHDLRHAWASELAQAGVDDRRLQELGGWTSSAMVQRYSHLRVEHLLEALERPNDQA